MRIRRIVNAGVTRLIPVPALLALIAVNGCAANTGGSKPKHWDQTRRDASLQLAEENIKAGQFGRARGVLASFAEAPDARIQTALARCDIEEGRYDEALRRLDAIQDADQDARFQWLRGVALEGLGRWDAAAAAYEQAYRLEPNAQLFVAWLDALVLGGGIAEANQILARERARFPGEPVIILLASRLAERNEQFSMAIDELKTALLAEPKAVAVQHHLAALYMRAGRYAEAIAAWQRLIEQCDDAEARHALRRQLAGCLLAAGSYAEARGVYQVLVSAKPEDSAARLGYATACLKMDEPREALTAALQVLRDDRGSLEAAYLAGLCYRRLDEPAPAQEFLSGSGGENQPE